MDRITACAVALLLLVGCGGSGSGDSSSVSEDDTFESSARAATNRLRVALKSELGAALQSGGPVVAIDVCHTRAGVIASEISEETGLTVGRVARRNRNPANEADAAQAAVLTAFATRPSLQDTVVTIDGQRTYLRAIRIDAPACLNCHGPAESLDPDLVQRIADLYPDDRATGFSAGDLRGAFVVR